MSRNRERQIEDAIIAHPEALGFPGASAIRNVHLAWQFGRIDVLLLPRKDPVKLVLVEAKHTSARDATSKVVGQLLMYYSGALRIGKSGLGYFSRYADDRDDAVSDVRKSPKKITGGLSPPAAAWAAMQKGRKLRHSEIRLFVAINAQPREALCAVVAALEKHHDLKIGLVVVDGGEPRLLEDS